VVCTVSTKYTSSKIGVTHGTIGARSTRLSAAAGVAASATCSASAACWKGVITLPGTDIRTALAKDKDTVGRAAAAATATTTVAAVTARPTLGTGLYAPRCGADGTARPALSTRAAYTSITAYSTVAPCAAITAMDLIGKQCWNVRRGSRAKYDEYGKRSAAGCSSLTSTAAAATRSPATTGGAYVTPTVIAATRRVITFNTT
jgi:hypothetical protein